MAPPLSEGTEEHKRQKVEDNNATKDPLKFPEVHQLLKLLKTPPSTDMDLASLTKLDLFNCGLSTLPSCLPDALPNLSIAFLSNNQFTEMPAVIGACQKLQMVAFKSNGLTSIHPDALQSQLRWLILTDNKLTKLPDTLGRCKILQKFMLSGNLLTELPDSISECHNLELIRLSSNQLEEPPMKLLELPNLCWVALSDNPFVQHTRHAILSHQYELPMLEDIPEGTGEILGEGAGGITRKVKRTSNGEVVAVKTFRGAMTSDGTPDEERHTSLTVFSKIKSPFLITLLGEAPCGSLVMEYLDHYHALAGPPSMETCSRDVYTCDKTFMTQDQAISMVTGLLDVLYNLHKHGICHGDFYAHNILVSDDDRYKVKLSDFGAATFYDNDLDYGKPLQQTELRAFAHFVTEVTELFVDDKKGSLEDLVKACREKTATFEKVNKFWSETCK